VKILAPALLAVVVAAVTALAVVTLYPDLDAPPDAVSGETGDLSRDVELLHARIIDLERNNAALGVELSEAHKRIARLEDVSHGVIPRPEEDPAPEASPESPGDPAARSGGAKPDEGQMEAAAKALAEKSRQQALDGIRAMLKSTDEYVLSRQQRIVQDVREFAKEAELDTETARAVAYALIDAQKTSTHRLRAVLEGRDLEKLTLEDMQPLIGEMFEARTQAVDAHLEPQQMAVFRSREEKRRVQYDDWLKLAFPSRAR